MHHYKQQTLIWAKIFLPLQLTFKVFIAYTCIVFTQRLVYTVGAKNGTR